MERKNERPEDYPNPKKEDTQFNNQPEFMDHPPNNADDSGVSSVATKGDRQTNDKRDTSQRK